MSQVCSLNFNGKILGSQLIKSLTNKIGIGVVTSTYRFKNRPVQLGPHLTINDCTSVTDCSPTRVNKTKKQLKHNKELLKGKVGYDLLKYS